MTPSDKTRFSEIMMGMADNFRDFITKPGMRMRFDMLKDFTIEQVETAAISIMSRRKYTKMPPVAEFIEELRPQDPAIEDRALVMANKILAHLKRNGAGIAPDFCDPIANYIMRTRWPYFRWASSLVESEEKWWVKQFCEAYRAEEAVDRFENPVIDFEPAGGIKGLLSNIGK